jgi:hypothetical protein
MGTPPNARTAPDASSRDTATDRDKDKPADDLTQMMSRASNYMTLAYVKIPSVVLCLSYKGRGERNIEDVHNFVFRMPALEYRNKTWSNLDLALRLKKDVIRALISHTGAIIGNKFSHHRPSKGQQSRLREMATSSSLLPNTDNLSNTLKKVGTVVAGRSESREPPERPETSHGGFIAGWGAQSRPDSEVSSLDGMISPGNNTGTATSSVITTSTNDSRASSTASSTVVQSSRNGSYSEESSNEPNQTNRFLHNSFARRITEEGQKLLHRDSTNTLKGTNGSIHKGDGGTLDSEEK